MKPGHEISDVVDLSSLSGFDLARAIVKNPDGVNYDDFARLDSSGWAYVLCKSPELCVYCRDTSKIRKMAEMRKTVLQKTIVLSGYYDTSSVA